MAHLCPASHYYANEAGQPSAESPSRRASHYYANEAGEQDLKSTYMLMRLRQTYLLTYRNPINLHINAAKSGSSHYWQPAEIYQQAAC